MCNIYLCQIQQMCEAVARYYTTVGMHLQVKVEPVVGGYKEPTYSLCACYNTGAHFRGAIVHIAHYAHYAHVNDGDM